VINVNPEGQEKDKNPGNEANLVYSEESKANMFSKIDHIINGVKELRFFSNENMEELRDIVNPDPERLSEFEPKHLRRSSRTSKPPALSNSSTRSIIASRNSYSSIDYPKHSSRDLQTLSALVHPSTLDCIQSG
jgi:hypothetical protein